MKFNAQEKVSKFEERKQEENKKYVVKIMKDVDAEMKVEGMHKTLHLSHVRVKTDCKEIK